MTAVKKSPQGDGVRSTLKKTHKKSFKNHLKKRIGYFYLQLCASEQRSDRHIVDSEFHSLLSEQDQHRRPPRPFPQGFIN